MAIGFEINYFFFNSDVLEMENNLNEDQRLTLTRMNTIGNIFGALLAGYF